jgi:hypothetical protein
MPLIELADRVIPKREGVIVAIDLLRLVVLITGIKILRKPAVQQTQLFGAD